MPDGRDWKSQINSIKGEIFSSGTFPGDASIWSILSAMAEAICEIEKRVPSTDGKGAGDQIS